MTLLHILALFPRFSGVGGSTGTVSNRARTEAVSSNYSNGSCGARERSKTSSADFANLLLQLAVFRGRRCINARFLGLDVLRLLRDQRISMIEGS